MEAFQLRPILGWCVLAAFLPIRPRCQAADFPWVYHPEKSVAVSVLAGASLAGPTLGAKARFPNGLELGLRHAQMGKVFAQDAGLYYVFPPDEDWMGRPYVGSELFRSNRNDRFGREDILALLLTVGREHKVSKRLALSYDLAGGTVLKMRAGDMLPPLTAKARVQFLCRLL